jgi:MFS-type transporter involved in bile tolerance (Atg22 family)
VIYNLIGRATVWFVRYYIGRRVPRSALVVAVAAVVGVLFLAGGTALTVGSRSESDPDY